MKDGKSYIDGLTCSVIVVDKRGECAALRLCRRRGDRMIEAGGQTLFAVCSRHIDRVRKSLGIAEKAA